MPERRILLVEDDATLRELIAEALRDDGYSVETAADGELALAIVHRWPPDLVILDLMMPHMDGEQFSEALRRINGLAATPIIVVSASRYAEEVGTRVGAEAALRKPFDLYELAERVDQALR